MARKRKEQSNGYYKPFPTRLRILMDETRPKHTQKELADHLGLTRQSVSYYRDGITAPDWETLAAIASFFSVSADWLIGVIPEDGPRTPNFEIRAVCEYTGLSEAAIGSLLECRADCGNVDGISCLLADTMRTDVLNESILNGIRNLPSTAPEVFSAEGDGGPIPIDRLDERAYEAVIRSDILDDYQEVRKRIQKAHCFLLGPDDTRIFYQERAAELVRDFIRGKRKLRIFDGAAIANQEE